MGLNHHIQTLRFPLRLGGAQIGRNVTLLRLRSGEVLIHSTAPFSPSDKQAICELGRPVALIDATLFHDTFAQVGQVTFPDIPYFAPAGFSKRVATTRFSQWPGGWREELDFLLLEGMPKVQEHVFFHRPSRTLIVADSLFNIGGGASSWTRFFFRYVAGIPSPPGISRIFRTFIKDTAAFRASARRMMEWDFDSLIVAHGEPVKVGAKKKVELAFQEHGLL